MKYLIWFLLIIPLSIFSQVDTMTFDNVGLSAGDTITSVYGFDFDGDTSVLRVLNTHVDSVPPWDDDLVTPGYGIDNIIYLANVVIINWTQNLNDNPRGGTITINRSDWNLFGLKHIDFIDIEEYGGTVSLFGQGGVFLGSYPIAGIGDNSYQRMIFNVPFVESVVIELAGSGAFTNFCWDYNPALAIEYQEINVKQVFNYHLIEWLVVLNDIEYFEVQVSDDEFNTYWVVDGILPIDKSGLYLMRNYPDKSGYYNYRIYSKFTDGTDDYSDIVTARYEKSTFKLEYIYKLHYNFIMGVMDGRKQLYYHE